MTCLPGARTSPWKHPTGAWRPWTKPPTLVAGALRWDSGHTAREVEHYRAEVAAQRASEEAGSDADAEAIADAVPDIVPVRTGAGSR